MVYRFNPINKPAMVALIRLDNVPAISARTPSLAISPRRLGAIIDKPPTKMAMELQLAKPHSANEIIAWVFAFSTGFAASLM